MQDAATWAWRAFREPFVADYDGGGGALGYALSGRGFEDSFHFDVFRAGVAVGFVGGAVAIGAFGGAGCLHWVGFAVFFAVD